MARLIQHTDGAGDCDFCGSEGALLEDVRHGEFFCNHDCYRAKQVQEEQASGCTCYDAGIASCPFHGEP